MRQKFALAALLLALGTAAYGQSLTVGTTPVLHKTVYPEIAAVAFLPDAEATAILGGGDEIFEWDLVEDRRVWTTHVGTTGTYDVEGLTLTRDGRQLVFGGYQNVLGRLETDGGTILSSTLRADLGNFELGLGLSPDDKLLLAGTAGGALAIDAVSLNVQTRFTGALDNVVTAGMSPDERYVYGADWYNVYIWDATSGALVQRIDTHYSVDKVVKFSPDFKYVAVSNWGDLGLYDVATGLLVHDWSDGPNASSGDDAITDLVFSPDLSTLISIAQDGKIRVDSVLSGNQTQIIDTGVTGAGYKKLAVTADQQYLAATLAHDVFLFKLTKTPASRRRPELVTAPALLQSLPGAAKAAIVDQAQGVVEVVDGDSGALAWTSQPLGKPVTTVAAGRSGRYYGLAAADGTVSIVDVVSRTSTTHMLGQGLTSTPNVAALSDDGKFLTVGQVSQTCVTGGPGPAQGCGLQRWDVNQGSQVGMANPDFLVFAPYIVAADDATGAVYAPSWLDVVRFSWTSGDIDREYIDQVELGDRDGMIPPGVAIANIIHSMAVSADGALLGVGYQDRILVFSANNTQIVFNQPVPVETSRLAFGSVVYPVRLRFSQDATKLFSLTAAGVVDEWDLASKTKLRSWTVAPWTAVPIDSMTATARTTADFTDDGSALLYFRDDRVRAFRLE